MKRTQNTATGATKKDTKVGELLQKLRELDQDQLENVTGGAQAVAGRGRCGSQCMHHC